MLDKIQNIQKKIGKLTKDNKVSFGNTKYAYFDINQILEKLQPLLEEEGLVITQPIIDGSVYTRITEKDPLYVNSLEDVSSYMHPKSYIESAIKLPEGLDPQKLGSAITYYRRYTLVSLLALEAEDDDGKSASSGLNVEEWATVRNTYQNEGKITPEDWEKCNAEQKKIITEIKKAKLSGNEKI